jgi:hypothetical protein
MYPAKRNMLQAFGFLLVLLFFFCSCTSAGKAIASPDIPPFSKAGSSDTHAALVIVLIVMYFFVA